MKKKDDLSLESDKLGSGNLCDDRDNASRKCGNSTVRFDMHRKHAHDDEHGEACCGRVHKHGDGHDEACCGRGHKHGDGHDEACCGRGHKHGDGHGEDRCGHAHAHDGHGEACSGSGHEHGDGCGCGGHDHEEGESCGCGIDHNRTAEADYKKEMREQIILILVSLPFLVASYLLAHFDVYAPLPLAAIADPAWIAVVICGLPIFRGAFKNLRKGKITSALLISIAMTASLIMGVLTAAGVIGETGHTDSYFFAAGEIAFIMAIGELVETVTSGKSRSAIADLIAMRPTRADVMTDEGIREKEVSDIEVGERVLVRPGEIIAVDGVVVKGSGSVDTSSITGEFVPAEASEGFAVYAGTRNLESALEIEVTHKSNETTLSKLIDYVRKAEKNKAPIVRLADKWASYFVPVTCTLSVIVFFLTLFAAKAGVVEAVSRAITILVVVCPCALTLATPIAVAAGIGNASRKGILIKSGTAMEALAKVNVFATDKTGTLTEGKLAVEAVYPEGISETELLEFAAAAEEKSEHPIARAITKANKGRKLASDNVVARVGSGISAVVEGKEITVTKLDELKDRVPVKSYDLLSSLGATVVGVTVNGEYKGAIAVTDTVRTGAATMISELESMGISTLMLTGDNARHAEKIASLTGITDVKADLLPEEKVKALEVLKAEGKKVLMAGDGVNDAPSLAVADASVTMGAMGSSVAIETADVALMSDDVRKLPYLLKLARRTLKTIYVNLTVSLTISVASVFLSAFGVLNAVSGALVHNASSVIVCISGALLLLYKPRTLSETAER